jgi:hypothetical protein
LAGQTATVFGLSRFSPLTAGVPGVSGVSGWDEGLFAGAFEEGPSFPGFEGVVVVAQSAEQVEHGVVGVGPVDVVVDFEVGVVVAALGGAGGVEPFEGAALVGGGLAAEVGDADDFFAFGHDGGDEGVA